jgi:hypothetical protein
MHAADVMDTAGDHARTVSGNDPAESRHRRVRPAFGQQTRRVQPVAAIAGHLQHRQPCGDLAEQDDTSGHERILVAA